MIQIFERGYFRKYRITDSQLNEALIKTKSISEGRTRSTKTTIFLSHKHNDLQELKDLIGFFSHVYDVDIYIDSMDNNMPRETSGETAKRIKEIIEKSDRFILLATNDAIESKWCNWELGYGDAQKYKDRIALFPVKERMTNNNQYKGNEYMQIYPFIAYFDGLERSSNGHIFKRGYYVCQKDSEGNTSVLKRLEDWL